VYIAVPQSTLTFTRPTLLTGPSGITHPLWNAYAFAGANQVDHVGEGLIASFSNVPAATFTLHGPGITSVRFDSNNQHFAAFSAVLLDNFVLSNVPQATPVNGSVTFAYYTGNTASGPSSSAAPTNGGTYTVVAA